MGWPQTPEELERVQVELAAIEPPPWQPGHDPSIGAVFAAFPTGLTDQGAAGDPIHAAAVIYRAGRRIASGVVAEEAGASYVPGLLALREGPALERTIATVPAPDVVLVNATGRDHPRRAGLALHLGSVIDIPTVGVTDRPLVAQAAPPGPQRGDWSPLLVDGEVVGALVRTQRHARPLVVHAAWRTDVETAVPLVLTSCVRVRTPQPLREARRLAREARAASMGRLGRPPAR